VVGEGVGGGVEMEVDVGVGCICVWVVGVEDGVEVGCVYMFGV